MSIATRIEALINELRAKVGTFGSDIETHAVNFLNAAKSEEAAAESRVEAEISHLKSLGYTVVLAKEIAAELADTIKAPIAGASDAPNAPDAAASTQTAADTGNSTTTAAD